MSHCAPPGASLTLPLAQGPVPAQSVAVSPCPLPCWPQGSSQPLLLPKENYSKDLTFLL